MVDWSTVAIAAIAASAGIGGSLISGNYTMKALAKSHRRDDAAHFRGQVEALFTELDVVQQASAANIPMATTMASGTVPDKSIGSVNLGKLRAIVGLYFPELQGILTVFAERETAATVALRASIQAGTDPVAASGLFAVEKMSGTITLCVDLRAALSETASGMGASMRESIT